MHVLFLAVLITVTGQGTANSQPDMATETFTIDTTSANASQAASDNNRRYNAVSARLHELSLTSSDIVTTSYTLTYNEPQTPDNGPAVPAPSRRRGDYTVSRSLEIRLHNLNNVGKAIDAAVESGVTGVGDVSYGAGNTRALMLRAVALAVADARSQAQAMADAAGLHIVRIRSMQQGYNAVPGPLPVMRAAMNAAVAPPTQIEASPVGVSASVTIVYEAQ